MVEMFFVEDGYIFSGGMMVEPKKAVYMNNIELVARFKNLEDFDNIKEGNLILFKYKYWKITSLYGYEFNPNLRLCLRKVSRLEMLVENNVGGIIYG